MSGSAAKPSALRERLSDFLHKHQNVARRRRSTLRKLQRERASQASAISGAVSSERPFLRGRERWRSVDRDQRKSRRSLRLMCSELSGAAIQLHGLGFRSARIRPNGGRAQTRGRYRDCGCRRCAPSSNCSASQQSLRRISSLAVHRIVQVPAAQTGPCREAFFGVLKGVP